MLISQIAWVVSHSATIANDYSVVYDDATKWALDVFEQLSFSFAAMLTVLHTCEFLGSIGQLQKVTKSIMYAIVFSVHVGLKGGRYLMIITYWLTDTSLYRIGDSWSNAEPFWYSAVG